MTTPETATEQPQSLKTGGASIPFPDPPSDLIFDDGEPLESNRHRIAMNVLIESIEQALGDRSDFFVGGNMFLYYSQSQRKNREFRGPDVFVALGVDGTKERLGWVSWEEGGKYPDVIIELISPSTAQVDRGEKKQLYERTLRIPYYYLFDPFDPDSLEGWTLTSGQGYQPLNPSPQGWLWCDALGMWFGTWEGAIGREPATGTCHWLRVFDQQGSPVPLGRELAEQERQRAEQERQRAEQEKQRAEQERTRSERLAQALRDLGVDPNGLQ